MRKIIQVLWLLALGFPVPGASSPSQSLGEVIVLVESSAIRGEADLRKVRKVCRDLFRNIPHGINMHVRQVGERSDLKSCAQIVTSSSESSPSSLQAALEEAETTLCSVPEQLSYCSIRRGGLVVVGGGSKGQPLRLRGSCRLAILAVGVTQQDRTLQNLAEEARGRYVSLSQARGYAVAQVMREEVWIPAVQDALAMTAQDPETPGNFAVGLILVIVLSLALARNLLHIRKRVIISPPPDSPQAGLKVLSGRGSGADFKVPREGALLLGCTGGPVGSAANLLFEDPFVDVEHCEIREEDGDFLIVDRSGGWRTLVNQEEVRDRRLLRSGDLLQVGGTLFQFERDTR